MKPPSPLRPKSPRSGRGGPTYGDLRDAMDYRIQKSVQATRLQNANRFLGPRQNDEMCRDCSGDPS